MRANQLVGYGLVIGLNGTGDSLRNSPFTEQSLQSMLDRMGINVRNSKARTRNVAAVIVTAELPAFVGKGSRIDVTVSSLGDATSLAGGSLILTPLIAADNQIYAVAQGPLAVSGYSSQGKAESVTQGVPTTGRIPNGAMIEREGPGRFADEKLLVLELRNPDFNTAVKVADAINAYTAAALRRAGRARGRPAHGHAAAAVLRRRDALHGRDRRAVRAARRAGPRRDRRAHGHHRHRQGRADFHGCGGTRQPRRCASPSSPRSPSPLPFSKGETVVTPDTSVSVDEQGGNLAIVRGTNLNTLVGGLNRIGLKPNGIIAILQAIKSAGALQADLVVQ